MRKQSSTGDMQQYRRTSAPAPSVTDADGFTSVPTTSGGGGNTFGRSQSLSTLSNLYRNNSNQSLNTAAKKQSKNDNNNRIERSASGGSFAAFNEKMPSSSSSSQSLRGGKKSHQEQQQRTESPQQPSTLEAEQQQPTDSLEPPQLDTEGDPTPSPRTDIVYETPEERGNKAQNILREFFVGGDTDDVLLSIRELIGTVGSDGYTERGAKVIEKAVLLVLEMKQGEVDKFLSLYSQSFVEKSIAAPSIVAGLSEPLEFLEDITIDAPLATGHIASIVGTFVTIEAAPFDFLLDEYTTGRYT